MKGSCWEKRHFMNRTDLINVVSEKTRMPKASVASMLEATFDTIQAAVKGGQTVSFVGFGSFGATKRAARKMRNPSTGAEIEVGEKIVPRFSAGKAFKDAVNAPDTGRR